MLSNVYSKGLKDIHDKTGHAGYLILYKEIITKKYYWKNIVKDCKDYILKCQKCLINRGSKKVIVLTKPIISKGPKERFVVDGWRLHEQLSKETGNKQIGQLQNCQC